MARKARNRFRCIRTVQIDGRDYRGGQIYEFSNPPHRDYFKPIKVVKKKSESKGSKKED